MEQNESFEYTYSAAEQEELLRLREKYLPGDERARMLERLRHLDASVGRKAATAAIALGVLSTLVFGMGLCCCLVWAELFLLGIPVGILGIAGIALAYPVYRAVSRREKERVTPEILELIQKLQTPKN